MHFQLLYAQLQASNLPAGKTEPPQHYIGLMGTHSHTASVQQVADNASHRRWLAHDQTTSQGLGLAVVGAWI